jgi:PAS domain-containing protein
MMNAVIVVTPEHTISRVNTAACELLGYAENEMAAKPIAAIFGWSEDGPLKIPHLWPPSIPPVPTSFSSLSCLLIVCIIYLFFFLIPLN